MSRMSASWLAVIGVAILLTACTTTIDDAIATRGQAVDTEPAAALPAVAEITNTVTAAEVLLLAKDGRRSHSITDRRTGPEPPAHGHPVRTCTCHLDVGLPAAGPAHREGQRRRICHGRSARAVVQQWRCADRAAGRPATATSTGRTGQIRGSGARRTLHGGLVMSPEWTATMSTPVAERSGLGTFIVGDGRQGISTSGWAVSAPSGTPAFSSPDTKPLLLSFPTTGSHGSAHCRAEQCRHHRNPNDRRGPDRRPALVTAGHSRRT